MLTLKLLLIFTILLSLNLCGRGAETTTTTTAESDDESNDEDEEIDPEIPLWHLFDCNRIFESGPRPVHKEKDWNEELGGIATKVSETSGSAWGALSSYWSAASVRIVLFS